MDRANNQIGCSTQLRQAAVRQHPSLNGIDFVEFFEDGSPVQPRLVVTFLKTAPASLVNRPDLLRIEGGARVVGIQVTAVQPGGSPQELEATVSSSGDFSIYTLTIDSSELDPQLSSAPFSFKSGCPSPFDCRQEVECPPETSVQPILDYLSKDYASFRQLMLDLIPQRNPYWLERNPADLGIVLVELLAYHGDRLSYFQDAVANEIYLDTCRRRVSAKRHARLVDYVMHDGRNAHSFVHLRVASQGTIPQGAMLLTAVTQPLQGQPSPPGTVIDVEDLKAASDPALRGTSFFETAIRQQVDPLNNLLFLHDWGNEECCLARGATSAYLYTLTGAESGMPQAVRPPLQAGDLLLLEEVKGPLSGLEADADPLHRQVVRLIEVEETDDPLFQDVLNADSELQAVTESSPPQPVLPLLKVVWAAQDALSFPLCLSARQPETGLIRDVSVARGNILSCDHGQTVEEILGQPVAQGLRHSLLQVKLSRGPLTFQAMPEQPAFDTRGRLLEQRHNLDASPRQVQPAVVLMIDFAAQERETWSPVPQLLDSQAFDTHFVVDVDEDGLSVLRFGDDEYGRKPLKAKRVKARYRIGNGTQGNLGSGSLLHIVQPSPIDRQEPGDPDGLIPPWPDIEKVYQPLAALDGQDPESIEEVRQTAPRAFHAQQFRAVTEADYEEAALRLEEVAAAKATFRWTGSWHTAFVAVHPANPDDLVTESGGRTRLTDELEQQVRNHLSRFKLAGYDLEIRTALYVPLEIEIEICVARGHFRGDVLEAAHRALSNREYADGSVGFFHSSQFAFGESVYLSRLYEAVELVEGVDSALVTVFKRYWNEPNDELENGLIPMGDGEIARLDNDPNFQENGLLRLTALGGL